MNKIKIRKLLKLIYRHRVLYIMALPPMLAVFIFHYIPIYGVQIAFKDYSSRAGILGSEWVGLKHFKTFVSYPYFWRILNNTLAVSLASLTNFPFPIVFALMLNEMRNTKLKKICQTITYAPHFISTVLVCSMTVLFLNREGLFNIIGEILNFPPSNLMSEPAAFPWIYSISGLWSGLGWGTIIYMATLSGVSQELIEAAKIDGATRLQVVRHVNLPHLIPTIVTMFILRMGSLMSVGFEKVFLLQNPLNMEASSIISTYVYEVGIKAQNFSYSSAIGLFNNIINIILIMITNAVSKRLTQIGLW